MSDTMAPTVEQVSVLMSHVFALVQACPIGCVTTYSWIGKALGYPRGARMIGWIMNESIRGVPAQRVISSKGELTGSWAFDPPERMRQLLEEEGIVFTDDGHVDLKRYGWDPTRDMKEEELSIIMSQSSDSAVKPGERLMHLLINDVASPLRTTK